jgi:hypothetical protein
VSESKFGSALSRSHRESLAREIREGKPSDRVAPGPDEQAQTCHEDMGDDPCGKPAAGERLDSEHVGGGHLDPDDARIAADWIRGHRPGAHPEDVEWGRALDRAVRYLRAVAEGNR